MVEVPRLKKLNSSSGPSQGQRIGLKVRDQSSLITQQSANLASLGKKGVDIIVGFEDQKIASLSNEAEQEYAEWNVQKLQQLKAIQGDPTEAYANYETEEADKVKEILERRPNLNDRVKRHLAGNLNKAQQSQRIPVLKQRGRQQEIYENNLFESTVKLKKRNLNNAAGYIKVGDQGSFLPFDQNVSDIRTLVAKRGLTNGTVERLPDDSRTWSHLYQDTDGNIIKVKMDNFSKSKVATEVSEGVSSSVGVLIDTGYQAEAKELLDRYDKFLDPVAKAKLIKKFKALGVSDAAFDVISKVKNKSDSEQMAAIEGIQDEETKAKALQIKDSNDNRRENIKERKIN